MRAIYWNEEDQGLTFDSKEIPDDLIDKCKKLREEMLEASSISSLSFLHLSIKSSGISFESNVNP